MLFVLISFAVAQQLEYFTDYNFQKRTLISKHYVQYDWVIGFCENQCPQTIIDKINQFPDTYQKGLINLSLNPWIRENIGHKGVWVYYQNNTMCSNGQCEEVPQIYNIPKANFWELRMIVVQIGCVILVVFYILAFMDLKKRFWDSRKVKQE